MRSWWLICDDCDARVGMGANPDREKPEGWHLERGYAWCSKCWHNREYLKRIRRA